MPQTSPRSVPIVQVDAFTTTPFAGNPAAVCLLDAPRPDTWLQALAAEMNLSETAFLEALDAREDADFALRWFTPATEVELCGHATLASAHVLWDGGRVPGDRPVRFTTASGVLTCVREPSSAPGVSSDSAAGSPLIWMDFPAQPATELGGEERSALDRDLTRALGAPPVRVARSRFDLLVELGSEEAVRGLEPDMAGLAQVEARGLIVTAPGANGGDGGDGGGGEELRHDFVSRFFAPRVGVPEDPVTGSAHCCLAPWWSERLGRANLTGYQASRRGGAVRTELQGERVRLGGAAITVFTGEVLI